MKYCQNCGQQIKAEAKFCPYCGAQQAVIVQQSNQAPQQPVQSQVNQQASTAPQQPIQNQTNQQTQSTQQYAAQSNTQQYQQSNGQPSQPNRFANTTQQLRQQFQQFQQQYAGNAGNQLQLGFIGSNKYAVAHWNDLKTPESRKSVFWWTVLGMSLFSIAVLIVIGIVMAIVGAISYGLGSFLGTIIYILYSVYYVAVTVIEATAMIRRMRYLEKNPWLLLLWFIPIGQLYAIYLMIMDKPQPQQWNQQGYPNQGMQQPMNGYKGQQNYQNMQQQMPNQQQFSNSQQPNMNQSQQPTSQQPIANSVVAESAVSQSEETEK